MSPGKPWAQYYERLQEALEMESFSQMYGFTPDVYRSMTEEDKDIYRAIIKGRNAARDDGGN